MKLQKTVGERRRLLGFLRGELALSSGLISRLKYQNAFLVNGSPVHTDYMLSPGDTVTVILDEPTPDYPAEPGELSILYEDEALIVVDKPAGLLMHPTFHRQTGTLANRLLAYYAATGQHCAVHPVSRLDRDTFGVVLLAKNAHIHALLCHGEFQKTYEAVVIGVPSPEKGVISAPIARLSPESLLRCVRADGKEAITAYEVAENRGDTSLLRLSPYTGRTHQLRIHCAYLGHPILGDPQYYTKESAALSARFGCETQQLCARFLSFPHPLTQKEIVIESAIPLK